MVDEDLQPILGMEAMIDLNVVKISYDNFISASVCASSTFIGNYISVYDGGLGRLSGTVTLSINKEIISRILPTRIPVAMRSPFKKELDHFLYLVVIAKIDR